MTKMLIQRASKITVDSAADQVLMGVSIPSGSTISEIRFKGSMVGGTILTTSQIMGYALEAWILPVLDPDAASAYDTLFDNLVPKDTDSSVLDLDTAAADVTNFWEPGEMAPSMLVELGIQPERLYHRHRFLDMATGAIAYMDNAAPPTALDWQPGDRFAFSRPKRYRVRQPSVFVIAATSPAGDDTVTTPGVSLAESSWFQIKYVDHLIERLMVSMFGLVETGAETPWEEALQVLQLHIDPNFHEETGGQLVTQNYELLGEMTLKMDVPGTLPKGKLIASGR